MVSMVDVVDVANMVNVVIDKNEDHMSWVSGKSQMR
jgi:hypothetical protein